MNAWLREFFSVLGDVPTTQGSATVAWACILGTAVRYLFSHDSILPNGALAPHWVPDNGWLLFLLGLAGVSSAHWLGKRMTDSSYVAAKKGVTPPPTKGPTP